MSARRFRDCRVEGAFRDIALVRKIEARFHIGHRPEKRSPPGFIPLAQRARRLLKRLGALGGRLGVDQVREALRFRQIELAVFESAPREFARLGHSQAGGRKRIEHARDHGAAAVEMEFRHVFAREARRAWKPKRKPAVQDLAGTGVSQGAEGSNPRLRHLAPAQSLKRRARGLARDPYNSDARPSVRGGKGKDGHSVVSQFEKLVR